MAAGSKVPPNPQNLARHPARIVGEDNQMPDLISFLNMDSGT
jgi:hypothetical protein